MRYTKFGKFDFNVSSLSFGASSLGGVFHATDDKKGIAAVHQALEAGIYYLDVAPAYGGTRAETVLGQALRGVDRGTFYISTKAGKLSDPSDPLKNTFDYSRDSIKKSVEASMDRLGVDFLDIVHLHDFDYQHRRHAETALTVGMETLSELKSDGLIGGIGAGIYPMDMWKQVLLRAPVDAILVHNHYCLNDVRILELLPLATAKNVAVINASPFASSFLTGRGIASWHPATEVETQYAKNAADLCARRGTTLPKLAFQFASQHPDLPTTMFSTSRPEAVKQNIAWHEEPYDLELVAEVQMALEPVMNKQWDYEAKSSSV